MDLKTAGEKIIYDRFLSGAVLLKGAGDTAGDNIGSLFGRIGDSHYKHLTFLSDDCMRVLKSEKDIEPYKMLNPEHSGAGRFTTLIKRLVRKLTSWFVIPQARQQTIYNNVVINTLENSDEKHRITNEQLSDVNVELLDVHKKVDKIIKRNEFSDILDAWEHDY